MQQAGRQDQTEKEETDLYGPAEGFTDSEYSLILRMLQCWPLCSDATSTCCVLGLCFHPSFPFCWAPSRLMLAYPIVLTIVHFDGTSILSLHIGDQREAIWLLRTRQKGTLQL